MIRRIIALYSADMFLKVSISKSPVRGCTQKNHQQIMYGIWHLKSCMAYGKDRQNTLN